MKRFCLLIGLFGIGLAAYAQNKPAWVDNPSAEYSAQLYVTAVGPGADRQAAERSAIGSLTAFFKQSVRSSVSVTDRETQTGGRSVSTSEMAQSIEASAALDSLIGAEIKAVWNDTRNRLWYAVAVMDKAKCRGLYAAELDKAVREINTLANVSGGVTFETIARCKRAQSLTGDAGMYALVLAMLDGPNRQAEVSELLSTVNAALTEAKAIPVDVRVTGDVNGRVRSAFASVFTAAGFRTGNRNSRYALEVTLSTAPAPKTAYFNTRYTVDAVLKDTQTGAELFTYNIANRESHPASQEDADNRVIIAIPRRVADDFPGVLQEYLDSAD
ncbi:MAG: LPP20 family lipoprotein [Spirochaetaceae bacterium]|nr:LPP20 family lipoprotein [Spirochaetaceae bacterium]